MVLVSKYRRKIFNEGSFEYFKVIMNQVEESQADIEIIAMNQDVDHIHMRISIPPKKRVSDIVRTIKSISGRLLKKKFEYLRKVYWGVEGIWSDGYFVSTIGINEEIIQKYIEHQGQEDKGQAQLVFDL